MAIVISERGQVLLRDPLLNKMTAFSQEEKEQFHLYGLLPSNTETLEEQLLRCRDAFSAKQTPLEKHIYLRALQDRCEVLFYRFILDNLVEMMPIIYTPVVGEACQLFHRIYRQPRGLFINYPERDKMDIILAAVAQSRNIRVIVVTDGERILGLGDQGTGGLGIPIGKLSLYTACGGIRPDETLPVILDVGTNNQSKLQDPEYLGWRNPRITGKEYDAFVDQFVQGVKRNFPNALLQFEDFAQAHAYPLLLRYRDELCAFNDDIQGTAAVAVAGIIAATRITNTELKDHRIALLGAGSAGCGISEQLVQTMVLQGISETDARARFYLVDREGLLQEGMTNLQAFQTSFVQQRAALKNWSLEQTGRITLQDVIDNAKPTILLGVSGQAHQFTEKIIRAMASYCERPIIFPLSNPTSQVEATPHDLLHWTNGRALIATGSPFEPVSFIGRLIPIDQCNNSYIFPGVGLGVVAGKISRVTDGIMRAAAIALSELSPALITGEGRLLPELSNIRMVSQHIAKAVIQEAIQEKLAEKMSPTEIEQAIQKTVWIPKYETFTVK